MKVTLADPLVMVEGWTPDLDSIGDYGLRVRKTPEEMREERRIARDKYGPRGHKISQVRVEHKTVLTFDKDRAGVVYFLPGLWPRVKRLLDAKGIAYEVEDKRRPEIRPELDVGAFDGVEFRPGQDIAIALIAKSDCGIIATSTAWGKSMVISLLCKAYPTLNIVVTTSSTQVVSTLYEYLCKTIPGQVGILGGGSNRVDGKRVIVSTLKSLPNIQPEKVQLVLVDECWIGTRKRK